MKGFVNKMSKRKDVKKGSVLLELYNNKLLVSKVDEMLDEKKSYDFIIEFAKENYDFDISKSALTRYKNKREEAMETGEDLGNLLDKRRKNGEVIDIKSKEVKGDARDSTELPDMNREKTVYNDVEVLDEVIQKAFAGLQYSEAVEMPMGLKAMELKNKITGNQLQGTSLAGLKQLRLRQAAKEQAMTEIIMKYIPEEQHDEVYSAIEEAEQEFYENLDLSEEDRRITKALAGLNVE